MVILFKNCAFVLRGLSEKSELPHGVIFIWILVYCRQINSTPPKGGVQARAQAPRYFDF
jgi:hypothetical protein